MALISQSELEARIGRSLTANEASDFAILNVSIQAYVERIIGSGVEDESLSTRYYDGGVQNLSIDPCTDVTSVKYVNEKYNDVQTLDDDEYTLSPINRTVKIMLRRRNTRFERGFDNLAVTAKFTIYNDADTLAIVKDAMLSALENEISNTTNVRREAIEGYSVEFADSETKDALNKLMYLFPGV